MKLPIQIPKFKTKGKPPGRIATKPGQKLQATARRGAATMDDYDEEPTMRLSSALFVVLILHLVAIGGVMAFTKFKESHASYTRPLPEAADPAAQPAANVTTPKAPATTATASTASSASTTAPVTHSTSTKVKNDDDDAVPAVKDSGTIYTVQKGDNPVTIARHFKVKYDDLIDLNKIEDPRRLKIGQKLHIPVKAKLHETAAND